MDDAIDEILEVNIINEIIEDNIDEGIDNAYEIYIPRHSLKFNLLIEIINKLNFNSLDLNENIHIEAVMHKDNLNINLSRFTIYIYINDNLTYTLLFNNVYNFNNDNYYKLIYNNCDYIQTLYLDNNNIICFEILEYNCSNINYIEIFLFNYYDDLIYCKIEKMGGKCINNIFNNDIENINLSFYDKFDNYLINRHYNLYI
jgi:hypothetical protein